MKTGGHPGRWDEAGWKQEPGQKSKHGAGGGMDAGVQIGSPGLKKGHEE